MKTKAADSAKRVYEAAQAFQTPTAYVDLDAFDFNAQAMAEAAGGTPIRVATKSIRCVELIRRALNSNPVFKGLMAFSASEAVMLANEGFDDILVAYPTVSEDEILAVCKQIKGGKQIVLTADSIEHVATIQKIAELQQVTVGISLEIDAAYRPLQQAGRRVHIGTRRSPLRTFNDLKPIVSAVTSARNLKLVGLMAYEGQVAGVGDDQPGKPIFNRVLRGIQSRSLDELQTRVREITAGVETLLATAGAEQLKFVNAGGTGSLSRVAEKAYASELTAGSGFYCPLLFDNYQALDLQPAAFYSLPVVRAAWKGTFTALGGGYIASGPVGADRAPQPVFPLGLQLTGSEGAGEVQTPLAGRSAKKLKIGESVVFRHAKAGELCERFAELKLIQNSQVVGAAASYRGQGLCFF